MPVQSMITSPAAGDVISASQAGDSILVRGIAWGGGGSGVSRARQTSWSWSEPKRWLTFPAASIHFIFGFMVPLGGL
jgi:hypothetical protein